MYVSESTLLGININFFSHPVLMQVPDDGHHPLHDGLCLSLAEELLSGDLVQQLPAAHVVEHEVDAVRALEEVPHVDDERVLPVAQEDLHLLGAVAAGLVDDLGKEIFLCRESL